MWKQFKKVYGSKNQFWELSLEWLDDWFEWNETRAFEYLNGKFWDEIDDIKDRIQKTLIVDWKNYDS